MMKERTNPKSVAPHKVKGTVLFTVVIVMMVLIVFLMGALALATTASNRASKRYSEVQTQQTAKAAVEAIMSAMQTDVTIANAAAKVNSGHKQELIKNIKFNDGTVKLEDGSYAPLKAMGTIKAAAIEYVGDRWILNTDSSSENYGKMEKQTMVKIWATATQGNAESSYAIYVSHGGGGGGSPTAGSSVGFVSTGAAENGTKTSVFGGSYIGFDKLKGKSDLWIQNKPTALEADVMVNGNLNAQTGVDLVFSEPGKGLTVWDNARFVDACSLNTSNDPNTHKSTSFNYFNTAQRVKKDSEGKPVMSGSDYVYENFTHSYTDVPYIYVEKTLHFDTSGAKLYFNGFQNDSYAKDYSSPLNIFCGQMVNDTMDNSIFGADIYCYNQNTGDKETVTYTRKGSTESVSCTYDVGVTKLNGKFKGCLYNWTAKVVNLNGDEVQHQGGSFYSKGDLIVNSAEDVSFKDVKVQGNVTLNGKLKVHGDLYVGGTLAANGKLEIDAGGHIYCDNASGLSGGQTAESYKDKVGGPAIDPSKTIPGTKTLKSDVTFEQGVEVDATLIGSFDSFGYAEYSFSDGTKNHIDWNQKLRKANEGGTDVIYIDTYSGNQPDSVVTSSTKLDIPKVKVDRYMKDGKEIPESQAFDVTPPQYFDTEGNPATPKSIFPAEFEKEVILGHEAVGTHPISDTKIITTVDDILDDENPLNPYKTIYEIPDTYKVPVKNKVINFGGNKGNCTATIQKYKYTAETLDKPAETDGAPVVETFSTTNADYKGGADGYYIINDSCTIKGDIKGANLIFAPPKGGEIWVQVDGLTMNNQGGFLILDDLNSEGEAQYGKVNFLLKGDLSFVGGGPNLGGQIITSTVKKLLATGSTFQIYTNEGFKVDGVDNILKSIPCDIYADKDEHKLNIANTCFLTANLKMPYCDLVVDSNSVEMANKVYYNGFKVKDGYHLGDSKQNHINLIGCAVVKNLDGQCNDFLLLYVPEEATAEDTGTVVEDAILTSWRIVKYDVY